MSTPLENPSWLQYANRGATRNRPLSPQLIDAFGRFLPGLGLTAEVFSGGQPTAAEGGARTGSVRHDDGNAGDMFFFKDGRRLDWANPQDLPIFQEIVKQGKAAGLTGFGAGPGYMQPGSMHIGYGHPGVWGAGGSSRNAPTWLVDAFGGAPASKPMPSYDSLMASSTPTAPTMANVQNKTFDPVGEVMAANGPVMGSMGVAQSPVTAGSSSPVPPAVVAAAAPSATSSKLNDIFGAMAMGPQQGPQFSPVNIQGPSAEQANALSTLIQALKGRMA